MRRPPAPRTAGCPPARLAAVLAFAIVLVAGWMPTAAAATDRPVHELPVPGRVLRGFDAPRQPYGPGHHGVDLQVAPGEVVRASAAGRVVAAGPVVYDVWVTIEHPDGVRTSYGSLSDLTVRVGETVEAGQPLGRAVGRHNLRVRGGAGPPTASTGGAGGASGDAGLHWSARVGTVYLDPLSLLRRPERPTLVGAGGWQGVDLVVEPYAPHRDGAAWRVLAPSSPVATRPGYALPPNHHHLVMVAGFVTSGPEPLIDGRFLGYASDSVSTFSYAGCDVTPSGCAPRRYDARDTHVEVELAAIALRDHLRRLQLTQPGRPVDLLGHSMGGDIATTYLERWHDPTDPLLPPIGRLVTVATPHAGSDTAALARTLRDAAATGPAVAAVVAGASRLGLDAADGGLLDAPAIDRYGTAAGSGTTLRDVGRLAELGIEVLQIAGSRDGVVSVPRAGLDGFGTRLVLPGGHGGVLDTEAAHQAVHDFLAGRPVRGAPADGIVGWPSRALAGAQAGLAVGIDVLDAMARLVP